MEVVQNVGRDDRFLYALSHDLREPARMVGQLLKLVKTKLDKQLDKDTSDYLMYAIDASDRMDSMIKSLAELNKVKAYEEDNSVFSPSELLEKVQYKLRDELKFTDAKVTSQLDEKVEFKKTLVEKTMVELVHNCVQHAKPENQLEINCRVTVEEHSLILSVSDNGTEIPEFWLEKSFEPFKKANKKSKNDGIGLTKLKILAEKFGGNIKMERLGGTKTCVTCRFPLTTSV